MSAGILYNNDECVEKKTCQSEEIEIYNVTKNEKEFKLKTKKFNI